MCQLHRDTQNGCMAGSSVTVPCERTAGTPAHTSVRDRYGRRQKSHTKVGALSIPPEHDLVTAGTSLGGSGALADARDGVSSPGGNGAFLSQRSFPELL